MKKKIVPMARFNTRIRLDQQKFIKRMAKVQNLTEGDVLRMIINNFMGQKK